MQIIAQSLTQPLTAKVTWDQRKQVEALARDLDMSMSQVTRLALSHFLDLRTDAARRYAESTREVLHG